MDGKIEIGEGAAKRQLARAMEINSITSAMILRDALSGALGGVTVKDKLDIAKFCIAQTIDKTPLPIRIDLAARAIDTSLLSDDEQAILARIIVSTYNPSGDSES